MFKIISRKKYNYLIRLINHLRNENQALKNENQALKNDVIMLKSMLISGNDIDFPNSSKGGVKHTNRNFNINDILQN